MSNHMSPNNFDNRKRRASYVVTFICEDTAVKATRWKDNAIVI